jgi:kinetochore protein Mis13/DSN1
VDDGSLYKHIDSELPDPDRARQLIILCAARAPLPAPREGKDPPSEPSEKGTKLLQGLKDNVLRLLAERKIDLNATSIDRPGSPANGSLDVRPNEQNVNNRARTTRFKDEIRMYVIPILFYFLNFLISIRTAEQSQKMTRGLLLRSFTILTKKQW